MKLEMKKIALVLLTAILIVHGAYGADEEVMPANKKMSPSELSSRLKQIPKFQKLKFINKVQDFLPKIKLNESLPEPAGPGIRDFQVYTKKRNDAIIAIPGNEWPMFSLRLVFKDKMGETEIDSGEKIIPWKSSRDKKAEILNIFAKKLEGIDVTFQMDKDTLILTIERKAEAKKLKSIEQNL